MWSIGTCRCLSIIVSKIGFFSILSVIFFNQIKTNQIEICGNVGGGFLSYEFRGGLEANVGVSHVLFPKIFKDVKWLNNFRVNYGIYGGPLKYLKEPWIGTENYACVVNLFAGIRYLVDEKFDLGTNLVWNPYILGTKGWKNYHLFSKTITRDKYNLSLLGVVGIDGDVKWTFWKGMFVGVGVCLRFNLYCGSSGLSFNGNRGVSFDRGTLRILIGGFIDI